MTRVRIALVAAVVCLAASATIIPTAVAAGSNGSNTATTVPPLYKLHVNGVSKSGKRFTGTYAIQGYVVSRAKHRVFAIGTLTGRFQGGRRISRGNVLAPASLQGGSATTASRSPRATSCTILHLVLGPIRLNLLGLFVTLGGGTAMNQPIVLDVTAQQGAGLLGDLLCGIDNALSGTGVLSGLSTQLQNLATTLNNITALLGGGAAIVPGV